MHAKSYKMIYPDDQEYYSLNNVLTYNADFNLIFSIRNLGKSYSARKLIAKSVKNGHKCCWFRWSINESQVAYEKFRDEYPEFSVEKTTMKNVKILADSESGGKIYFFAVKQAAGYKDCGITDLRWVCYDEFVPEFYDVKTRRDVEFDKFMSLLISVKRDCNPRVLMIANCIDWFNPFCSRWQIFPFNQGEIKIFRKSMGMNGKIFEKRILVENVKPTKAMVDRVIEAELLKGNAKSIEEYFKNATKYTYDLIEKCENRNIPLANVQFRKGEKYYSYRKYNGLFYFELCGKRDVPTECPDIMTIRKGEERTPEIGNQLQSMVNRGIVRFDNGITYNDICNMIYKYRNRL